MGETREIVKLGDETLWEVGLSLELLLALLPSAVICPSTGELLVEGKTIPVTQITEYVESRIDGAFPGFRYETVFNLSNGQIWQQIDFRNSFATSFNPSVLIYRSRAGTLLLKVEGIAETVRVRQLR